MKAFLGFAGIALCLVLYVFFSSQPMVTYVIYLISFLLTIVFNLRYDELQLTTKQAGLYSFSTVTITFGLFFCMVSMKNNRPTVLIIISAAIIGLLNVVYAMELQDKIQNKKQS